MIGRDGALPWHLPQDLRRFKRLTSGHPVIMGRRTWETLDKALPNRINIVITRRQGWQPDGALVVHTIADAVDLARAHDTAQLFVLGGGEIYELALPLADAIELTLVHTTCEGDAHFPIMEPEQWELTNAERHEADDDHAYAYTFQTWARLRA